MLSAFRFYTRLAIAGTCLLVAACGEDPGIDPAIIAAGPATGELQFINLIPDAPEIQVQVGPNVATVNYREATVSQSLPLGNYTLRISYVGSDREVIELFDDISIEVDESNEFKVLLRGSIANPSYEITDLRDTSFVGEVQEGTQQIWVAGGLASDAMYDVYITNSRDQVADVAPTLTVSGQGQTDLVTIDAAPEFRMRVTNAGSKDVLFDSGDFLLPPQSRSGFAIIEYFGPAGDEGADLDAIAFASVGAQAFPNRQLPSALRLVNVVSDEPLMDLYFGSTAGEPFVADLTPLEVTPYLPIESGRVSLNLTLPGVKDQFLFEGDETVLAGSFHTLILRGRSEANSFQTIMLPVLPRPVRDRVLVNVVNASNQLSVVRVELLAPGQDFLATGSATDLSSGGVQGTFLPPGEADLVILSAADVLIHGPERISFEEDKHYTVILSDRAVVGSVAAEVTILVEDTVAPRSLAR